MQGAANDNASACPVDGITLRIERHSNDRRTPMFRYALIGLAAAALVGATLVPDDALARAGRGGGGGYRGGGGFHGGGAHYRGGAVHAGRYGGRAHVANRMVRHPYARTAARAGVYRGAAYRGGAYRGYRGYGAAAVGAAALGAAAYGSYGYNNRCHYDAYGSW